MRVWDERVLPRLVDATLSTGPVHRLRAEVCSGLSGRVLEIGFGSGLNQSHYPEAVTEVVAVEPSDLAWQLAQRHRVESGPAVVRSGLDGQALLEGDDTCDAALITFTLCTIPDHLRALAEVRRVLRPGAEVHFVEHGLSPDPAVARWQHRLEPLQRRFAGGCHLTRDPVEALEGSGFDVVRVDTGYLPGPRVGKPFAWTYRGVARLTRGAGA